MQKFNIIKPEDINDNVFKLIDKDWFLITAGNKDSFNTMTASWGGMGILWNKPVVFAFVRPTRHTYLFTEENEYYTVSFFEEKYREALRICGTKSGKNVDKMELTKLTPIETEKQNVYFNEAKLMMECKKLYFQDLDPKTFIDKDLLSHYNNDYHRMYIGQITMTQIKQ